MLLTGRWTRRSITPLAVAVAVIAGVTTVPAVAAPSTVETALSRAGWTATADPSSRDLPANALDGNLNTRWSSGTPMTAGSSGHYQTFEVDMKSVQRFDEVVLDSGPSTGDYARDFFVEVSLNGTDWLRVATGVGTGPVITIKLPPTNAYPQRLSDRYLRVLQYGTASNWWSIAELNVYNSQPIDVPTPNAGGVAIDVGGTVNDGTFVPDEYGTGGGLDTKPAAAPSLPNFAATVAHPIPASVWDTSRVGESAYVVPGLTPGATYQLRLYFLDWYYTHPGQRVFNVTVNGQPALTDFDITQAAIDKGADGAESFGVERDLNVTAAADGTVSIAFLRGSADQPQINALNLVPATSPPPLAAGVQIDAGGSVNDGTFVPDEFGTGGTIDVKPAASPTLPNFSSTVAHPISADVWDTARLGASTYAVPGLTPKATYELRLYFLDWHNIRPGQRVFDVTVNGAPALTDFDITQAAVDKGAEGQESFGVERDLTVTADATGTVTVGFVAGAAEQPLINALSLVQPTG